MEAGYAVAEEAQHAKVPLKKKKIGFFKRWMLKSVKEAVDAERRGEVNLVGASPDVISSRSLKIGRQEPAQLDQQERAINFTVYVASGGRIVETRRYDRKTDRHSNGLYIITNEQDFGREIDKIITMEALK